MNLQQKHRKRIFLTDLNLEESVTMQCDRQNKTTTVIRRINRKNEENQRCHKIWAVCE